MYQQIKTIMKIINKISTYLGISCGIAFTTWNCFYSGSDIFTQGLMLFFGIVLCVTLGIYLYADVKPFVKKYSYHIHSLLVAVLCAWLMFFTPLDLPAQILAGFFGILALGVFISLTISNIKYRNFLRL